MSKNLVQSRANQTKRAELLARCEAQRVTLGGYVADIEQRLQGVDATLGSIRNALTKPSVLAGGAALLFTFVRMGWWSKVSRGLVMLSAARRIYQVFNRR